VTEWRRKGPRSSTSQRKVENSLSREVVYSRFLEGGGNKRKDQGSGGGNGKGGLGRNGGKKGPGFAGTTIVAASSEGKK